VNQTTSRTLPPPVGLSDVTAHLVADHDWPARTPLNSEHAQAHDYLHGVGRADLADTSLTHMHGQPAGPPRWNAPAENPADPLMVAADYARRTHWWVRLIGIIVVTPLVLAIVAVVMVAVASATYSLWR
jgi:hypothetical protein